MFRHWVIFWFFFYRNSFRYACYSFWVCYCLSYFHLLLCCIFVHCHIFISTRVASSIGQQLSGVFFFFMFIQCRAQWASGPRLILKYYGDANYNIKLDMNAVVWLAVEVINTDLSTLFDFVSNNILLSKLGNHGQGETRISMPNLFSSPVVWHSWARKDILNEVCMLFPIIFISILHSGNREYQH